MLAAVYATGAFTSTTAERDANVNVAGDASAFLALQKSDGPNSAFASYGSNGELQVKMGGRSTGGTGVNPDSTAEFGNVFTITNKGTQPVSVWLTDGRAAVTFTRPDGTSLERKQGAATLQPGGESLHVGLEIDARGVKPGANLLESVTVHTDASAAGVNAPAATRDGGDRSSGSTSGTTTASATSGPALPIAGGVPGSRGEGRFYSVESPGGLGEADGPTGLAGEIARDLAPFGSLGSVLAQRGNEYEPPVVPVDETPITDAAKQDLTGGVPFAYRNRVEEIIYGVLESPLAADRSGEYRYMVGTHPSLDGWVGVWVRDGTVVAVERGGRDRPPNAVGVLQEPITLTRPDARTVRIDPADTSQTVSTPEAEIAGTAEGNPTGLIMVGVVGLAVVPAVVASPVDETVVATKVVERFVDRTRNDTDDPPLVPDGGRSPADIERAIGDGEYVEDDLTSEEYRHIAEEGNADETIVALDPETKRTSDSEVIWLEEGDSGTGWKHILQRHEGDFHKRPSISNRKDIMKTIYEAVKNGEPEQIPEEDGGGTAYQHITDSGGSYTVIVGDNGYVVTAHPGKSKYHAQNGNK